ncbi:MAG: porin [Verrucomicrobiota bacterium]|nr:porin [Verrucomicrobiota bacterium]
MKLKHFLIITALGLQTDALRAGDVEEIRALRKQIEELDQKVKILEQKNQLENKTTAPTKVSTPMITAGAEGFSFRSADTNFVLRIRGYGQFDGRYFPSSGPGRDTFLIRRLRLGLEGTVFKYYDYKILTDFGSGITSTPQNNSFLQDAYLNIHYWPEFQFQLGKYKEPVSLEVLQSDANLLFVERGLPTQLAPNRDVGIEIHGDLLNDRLNYALGIFNGVADGGSGDIETADNDKDFAGRIFARPFNKNQNEAWRGIGFGVGGTFGHQNGALPSYSTPGRQKFFSYHSGTGLSSATANVSAAGEIWRIAPQAHYYYGPFQIFGEYIQSSPTLRREAGGAPQFVSLDNRAWNVAASYVLTGEKNTFDRPLLERPFSLQQGNWGTWEIAARYGELTMDPRAFPLFASNSSAQKITSWGLGLNWYLNKNVKFMLDYEQSYFNGGSKKSGAVTAQDEKAVLARAQFAF